MFSTIRGGEYCLWSNWFLPSLLFLVLRHTVKAFVKIRCWRWRDWSSSNADRPRVKATICRPHALTPTTLGPTVCQVLGQGNVQPNTLCPCNILRTLCDIASLHITPACPQFVWGRWRVSFPGATGFMRSATSRSHHRQVFHKELGSAVPGTVNDRSVYG